jgi:hypothetical protein
MRQAKHFLSLIRVRISLVFSADFFPNRFSLCSTSPDMDDRILNALLGFSLAPFRPAG